jgi:hypothetical protein
MDEVTTGTLASAFMSDDWKTVTPRNRKALLFVNDSISQPLLEISLYKVNKFVHDII